MSFRSAGWCFRLHSCNMLQLFLLELITLSGFIPAEILSMRETGQQLRKQEVLWSKHSLQALRVQVAPASPQHSEFPVMYSASKQQV